MLRPAPASPSPSRPRPRAPPGYAAPRETPASRASARQYPRARVLPRSATARPAADPGPRPSPAPRPPKGPRAECATSPPPDTQTTRACAPDAPPTGRAPARAASIRQRACDQERESTRNGPGRPPARTPRAHTYCAPTTVPRGQSHPSAALPRQPRVAPHSAQEDATNPPGDAAT